MTPKTLAAFVTIQAVLAHLAEAIKTEDTKTHVSASFLRAHKARLKARVAACRGKPVELLIEPPSSIPATLSWLIRRYGELHNQARESGDTTSAWVLSLNKTETEDILTDFLRRPAA